MPQIRSAREDDLPSLLDIWRRSVRATHDFLSQEDFRAIEADVAETYLPNATLWVMADADDSPLAFLGLSGAHVDSLFVDPAERGKGHGSRLIGHARRIAGRLTLDVNEQNEQASASIAGWVSG
ncbi:GNAT family N-acetyltransferase [Nitratireductor sp. ZSWI3]|uniref:GNAT family N-acetyltransferase n=1 Tax=Nitratireductor sp. ZSWI3 TaxID=2966359 RepID=UPI00214FEB13|nr:GNAT family N-acetyltransferase [Nitratireductor sp. ZSWI3]MCR4266012.1 GNAT family N-acetyltransferase [Nitratireductor sp. ZSWI3]